MRSNDQHFAARSLSVSCASNQHWTHGSEAMMQKDMEIRIDLNTNDQGSVGQVSSPEANGLGVQTLESRHMPLVVIAIIAILIGLLLPA
jgi:hypothetical protein